MWRFDIEHLPGKENYFSDATSRHPVGHPEDDTPDSSSLNCICIYDHDVDEMESCLIHVAANSCAGIRSVTWDVIKQQSLRDKSIQELVGVIDRGFPISKSSMPEHLSQFWEMRQHLYVIDDVVMMKHRIVVPNSLRKEIREIFACSPSRRFCDERTSEANCLLAWNYQGYSIY